MKTLRFRTSTYTLLAHFRDYLLSAKWRRPNQALQHGDEQETRRCVREQIEVANSLPLDPQIAKSSSSSAQRSRGHTFFRGSVPPFCSLIEQIQIGQLKQNFAFTSSSNLSHRHRRTTPKERSWTKPNLQNRNFISIPARSNKGSDQGGLFLLTLRPERKRISKNTAKRWGYCSTMTPTSLLIEGAERFWRTKEINRVQLPCD